MPKVIGTGVPNVVEQKTASAKDNGLLTIRKERDLIHSIDGDC